MIQRRRREGILNWHRCILLCYYLLAALPALAANDVIHCTDIADDATRLSCYDRAAGYKGHHTCADARNRPIDRDIAGTVPPIH